MMDPSQMMPSTPMTGPTPQKRRLSTAIPGAPGMPGQQQDGNGESEIDFATAVPESDYVVPARPSTLRMESEEPTLAIQLQRRHLNSGFGPRRL